MDETQWHRVGFLNNIKTKGSCLWYGSNIMLTGGQDSKGVEIFNTETKQQWAGKELPEFRWAHRMMLHNGMPTVVGGHTSQYVSSIWSYSIAENRWINQSMELTEGKAFFALVQV
jgi:hypothetical protein